MREVLRKLELRDEAQAEGKTLLKDLSSLGFSKLAVAGRWCTQDWGSVVQQVKCQREEAGGDTDSLLVHTLTTVL